MNYTDEAYIKLMANAIGKNKYDIDFSLMSLDRLMKLCAFHNTIGLVSVGMSKLENLSNDFKEVFETGLKLEVIEYVNKSNTLDKLSKRLSENEIKHILVKGKTVAKYYPQEELRRLGDIDLLISPDNKNDVKTIIEEMGGAHHYEESDSNVDFYKYENVTIEVHSKIVTGKRFSESSRYSDFSENAYASSEIMNDCLYELDFITSFVYNIYHTAKHFYEGGCGVRMIADLWLMKNAADTASYKQALDVLHDMGLKKFALKVFQIGEKWFGNYQGEISDLDVIQSYIITSGLYGKGNVGADVGQMRKAKKDSYVANVIKWLFPNYKIMRESSVWFENKPAILLPIAYIVRGYTNVKERGGIFKTIKRIFKGKKQNSNLNNMLSIMELDNE